MNNNVILWFSVGNLILLKAESVLVTAVLRPHWPQLWLDTCCNCIPSIEKSGRWKTLCGPNS